MTLVRDGASVYSSFAGLGSLSGFSTVDPGPWHPARRGDVAPGPPWRLHRLTALVICLKFQCTS